MNNEVLRELAYRAVTGMFEHKPVTITRHKDEPRNGLPLPLKSSQRITGTDARWYAVGADGQATLCINREDARDTAAEAAQCYPNNAPYTAVQMVPVGVGEAFGSRS